MPRSEQIAIARVERAAVREADGTTTEGVNVFYPWAVFEADGNRGADDDPNHVHFIPDEAVTHRMALYDVDRETALELILHEAATAQQMTPERRAAAKAKHPVTGMAKLTAKAARPTVTEVARMKARARRSPPPRAE